MFVYVYILAAYTQRCPANVNIKHGRLLNFGLVVTSISFWQPKEFPMGVANNRPHVLPYPHLVNNAHPVSWTSYAKFQPDCV